ncbi:glycosyltransferase family 4 protein [Pseudomonadota bacterium]
MGGFQLWLDRMCEYLPSLGWDVQVGFAQGKTFHDPVKFRKFYRHMEGIDIDGRDGTTAGRIVAVKKACRKVKPDIVIPVLLVDANMAVAMMKYEGQRVRHLYTYQGTHDWNIAEPERYAAFIDMCCGCNELATQTLLKRGKFESSRLASVPNGVPQRIEPATRPVQDGVLNLAYVGRIEHPDKRVFDIPGMLKVLDRLNVRYHLRIAGKGPQEAELLKRLSSQLQPGTFEHLGFLHFDELHDKVYSKADVLLFPSPWEGWPLVVGEAISAGVVPAAAAFRGVASERVLIPEKNTLLYQVGDVEAAGVAIAKLHRDSNLLAKLSAAAYKTSLDYSWERSAKEWSQVLERTMELPPVAGQALPKRPGSSGSRMSSLGIPNPAQIALRRVLRRQMRHASGNAEWPYRDKDFGHAELAQMENDLLELEQRAISGWPAPYNLIKALTRKESQ